MSGEKTFFPLNTKYFILKHTAAHWQGDGFLNCTFFLLRLLKKKNQQKLQKILVVLKQ